ncbi:MAG: hypothetical protein B6245_03740 [Desulfobacteraceae bacterium 4572_88]|nr:MAG: hypothetical protein B6245_03740 [Desulfobacteraceae bacterium 4572_88]
MAPYPHLGHYRKFIRISYCAYDVDVIWNFETGKLTDVIEKSPGLPVVLSASPGMGSGWLQSCPNLNDTIS